MQKVDDLHQNNGIFTKFIVNLMTNYSINIYVESILNPTVERICTKLNFNYIGNTFDINMYWINEQG